MGKLAELAGAARLKGAVTVTMKDGKTINYASEEDAEKACAGLTLEHRRGAFFEVGGASKAEKPAAKPAAESKPAVEKPAAAEKSAKPATAKPARSE